MEFPGWPSPTGVSSLVFLLSSPLLIAPSVIMITYLHHTDPVGSTHSSSLAFLNDASRSFLTFAGSSGIFNAAPLPQWIGAWRYIDHTWAFSHLRLGRFLAGRASSSYTPWHDTMLFIMYVSVSGTLEYCSHSFQFFPKMPFCKLLSWVSPTPCPQRLSRSR